MATQDLERAVRRARDWRSQHGWLPLVDDFAFLAADDLWVDGFDWNGEVAAQELAAKLLASLPSGPSPEERFVLLSTARRNQHTPWLEAGPDEFAVKRSTYATAMSELARRRPLGECTDIADCQWELAVAADLGLWARVDDLCAVWRQMEPGGGNRADLAHARVLVASLLLRESWAPSSSVEYPGVPEAQRRFNASFVTVLATMIGGAPAHRLDWGLPGTLPKDALERLYRASDLFHRAESEGTSFSGAELALSAWVDAVVGLRTSNSLSLQRALTAIDMILESHTGADSSHNLIKQHCLWAKTRLYAWLQDSAMAVRTAEELVAADDTEQWSWEVLAQLRRLAGDEAGWVQAYEEYVKRNADADKSWETTELLKLGLGRVQGLQVSDLLAAAPTMKVDVELLASVLKLEWPQFSRLSEQARQRWLAAHMHLSHPSIAQAIGDLRWAQAVASAVEAVASELRSRVTNPFAVWLESKGKLRELLARKGRELDTVRGLDRRGLTFGQIVSVLDSAVNQRGELGPLLRNWYTSHLPSVLPVLSTHDAIRRLSQLLPDRNTSSHGEMLSVDQTAALTAFREARAVLSELVEASPL